MTNENWKITNNKWQIVDGNITDSSTWNLKSTQLEAEPEISNTSPQGSTQTRICHLLTVIGHLSLQFPTGHRWLHAVHAPLVNGKWELENNKWQIVDGNITDNSTSNLKSTQLQAEPEISSNSPRETTQTRICHLLTVIGHLSSVVSHWSPRSSRSARTSRKWQMRIEK